jgi:hypothetical protein
VYDVDVDVCSMYLTVVVGDNHVLKKCSHKSPASFCMHGKDTVLVYSS